MDQACSNEPALADRLAAAEQQIEALLERNRRVEADKAWELSRTRKAFIVGLTYLLTCLVFAAIGVPNFWLSAVIPTIGYYLSTLSLPFVKRWWLGKYGRAAGQ
jgi:hypothetical protein